MNKLQKSKTLSLGRLATLSTIKENLRVKTAFQKNELPPPSPQILDRQSSHSNGSSYTINGGDTDSPPLLFSAISSYKPEKTLRPSGYETVDEISPRGPSPLTNILDTRQANGQPTLPLKLLVNKQGDQQHLGSNGNKESKQQLYTSSTASEAVQRAAEQYDEVHDEELDNILVSRLNDETLSPFPTLEGDREEEEYWSIPPKVSGLALDRRDLSTGDKWIPRHPDLVRVKGFHPLNAETPLTTLAHFGFLTPTSLHYVHNHGAVPQAAWDSWSVEVTGLVKTSKKFSMRDILLFPSRRLPVTLMCSGNRGKELSRVGRGGANTEGLKWGPGAVSTSVWGGAKLCDVLRHCGVLGPTKKKKTGPVQQLFVRLFGADRCGGTVYGTSIPLEVAMDESRDVLLAYEQNMDLLTPDHGFPLRLIVPGFTGARSVKWLAKIEICASESDNYYHLYENRMLPSQVEDMDTAVSEGWLKRSDFVINDMNINSVISSPAHNSNILSADPSNPMIDYSIKGYAYSGAGKKVARVEVSLDGGKGWQDCNVERPEQPTKFGKYWCWCFWEHKVALEDLSMSAEIVVRAWDSTMNTQPELYSWNLLGVMNNCWYRVKIQQDPTVDPNEPPTITFEHPTQPGNIPGGWLQAPIALGKEMLRSQSVKFRHSESSSSLDIGENSPRTPRPWLI